MEEFNKRFNELINSLHKDIKSLNASILIYYIESFSREMCYQLRDKEPTNLKIAQKTAIKVDKNIQSSGRSNLLGFTRACTSKQQETKNKAASLDNKESPTNSLKELTMLVFAVARTGTFALVVPSMRRCSSDVF
jgi:hypothetical protein